MKISFLKLTLLVIGLGFSASLFGQLNNPYPSIQIGYNARSLSPNSFNYAIDQYNSLNNLTVELSPVNWSSGFSVGLGYHRGRANFRLGAALYASQSHAIGVDSLGADFRRDVSLNGSVISLSMINELIKIYRDGYFLVGAALNFTNFNAETLSVPADMYEKDTPLTDVSNSWKTSFTILAPFRFGITPQFKISVEPYYQIFFSQAEFRDFSQAINGNAVPFDAPQLGAEPDHFGVNLSLMFLIRRN